MGCRVGMSRYPYTRISDWKDKEGHTSGRVLAKELTYAQVQAREKTEAEARDCYYHPGGDPGDDRYKKVWSVYLVSGGKTPND